MNIRSNVLLAVGTLLLAACSPTPVNEPPVAAVPVSPARPTALGALYQIRFLGSGTAQPAGQAASAQLRTQTLVGTPDPLGFTGVPLSVSSFTDKVNRVRHIRATFRVTNTSGRSLDNLTFIPVSTADIDGDASNNAAAPTLADTPFSRIEYFDGSDASARASALTPGAGRRLDAASGTGMPDLNVNPFKTAIDISQLFPAAPAGLSATALNVGWQVKPSLAPGESTTVTFGVDIQNVDPANPKADPYSFDLAFTAAEDSAATAATGRTIQTGAIRGTVSDPALFGGKLVLVNGVTYPQTSLNASAQVGISGAVELAVTGTPPSGDFSAAVPPIGDPCTFSGSVSDSGAIFAPYAGLLASSAGDDPVATIQETLVAGGSVPGALVARVFAPYPIDLKGKVSCWNRPTTQTYNLHLDAGWNAVEVSGSNGAVVFRNLLPDARSVLTVTRRTPGVTALLDDYSTINLKPGERVTRNVRLLQVGAYSGTVKLSTNVPGVTVEPGSVNLSPLGTQSLKPAGWQPSTVRLEAAQAGGLRAQSLSTAVTFVAAADAPEHTWYSFTDALIMSDGDGMELGRTRADVMLVVPRVYASINSAAGYQNETTPVTVTLRGSNGLDGLVNVSLRGLPDGVTVAAQNTYVSQTGTTVDLQLSVSATAAIGRTTIQVVTTPKNSEGTYDQAQLQIFPERMMFNSNKYTLLPAKSGLWTVDKIDYNSTSSTVRRLYNGNFQNPVVLPDEPNYFSSNKFIAGFDGDLIVSRTLNGVQNTYRVSENGSVINYPSRQSYKVFLPSEAASDAQKRIWFVEPGSYNSFQGTLSHLDPDGQVTQVDTAHNYNDRSALKVSNNGVWIVLRQNLGSDPPIKINTVTESIEVLPLNSFGNGDFSVSNDGSIWFTSDPYSNQNRLSHLSISGETIETPGVKASRIIGDDRFDPNVLWISSANIIAKLTMSGNMLTEYNVLRYEFNSTVSAFSLDPNGGIGYIVSEGYAPEYNYFSRLN